MKVRLLGTSLGIMACLALVGAGCPTSPLEGDVVRSTTSTSQTLDTARNNDDAPSKTPTASSSVGENQGKRYILHSPQECERARIVCQAGESFFSDSQGCGCEPALKEGGTMCPDIYMPVCGTTVVECIRAPCPPLKETYSNRCEAERAHVTSITNGACPKP